MAGEEGKTGVDAGADKGATDAAAVAAGAVADAAKGATGTEAGKTNGADKTLLSDTAGADKTVTVAADWPTDWREKMATGADGKVNEKTLNILKRHSSPVALANSALVTRQEISEGKLKPVLAADATPEQITAYRKDNGIPEKPEAYLENLPNGLVIADDDKPYVGEFAADMHKLNAPPQFVHSALQSYYQIQAKQAEAIEDANEQARSEGTEALIAEWGQEFKGNKNAIVNMLNGVPEDARKAILSARDSEGIFLFNQAPILRAFAQLARELNPASTVVNASGGDVGKALGSEIEQIEKVMKTDIDTYNRDPKMRARYLELLTARERMTNSGRAA